MRSPLECRRSRQLPASLAAGRAVLIDHCQRLTRQVESLRIEQGRILAEQNRPRKSDNVQEDGFQVFSQRGEDGILQYLTRRVEIANRTFLEFGLEDFSEPNCRLPLLKDNWCGAVLGGIDYWILEAITGYRPRILVREYNAVFGKDWPISAP